MASSTAIHADDWGIKTASPTPLPEIRLEPLIVAGDPTPGDPFEADSPAQRIDPNLPSSPFAGVGSLSITAPGVGTFLCSGTAISPRHILTAAHCLDVVEEDGILDVAPENVIFNLNAQGVDAEPIEITASELKIFDVGSDRYEGFFNSVNNDLAIVTLSEDLPAGIPVYDLAQTPLAAQSIITLVGYGTSGNGIDGHIPETADATIKRVGQNQVDDASLFAFLIPDIGEVFLYDFDGPDATTNALAVLGSGLTLGNQIETTVGPGDSGGPSFVPLGDEWLLVGVNTFGFAFPDLEAPETGIIQGTFGTGAGGVLVSEPEKLAWIQSIVGDLLGQPTDAKGSITGTVWNDLDGDGDRTPAEPLLSDWTVFLDFNENGLLDAAEPATLTDASGAYTFSELAANAYQVRAIAPAGWQQTFPQVQTVELLSADFSEGDAASLEGFAIDNSGAPVTGLWHLTTARGSQSGHSPLHSLYFGQNEDANGNGDYNVGHTAGRVISPAIGLVGLASAELTFNYFLNVEPSDTADLPRVRVTTDGNTFQTIAAKGEPLQNVSSQADNWLTASISLDEFVGSTVQIQFDFNTVDAVLNSQEGCFVDDVQVQGIGSNFHDVTLNVGETITRLDFGFQLSDSSPTEPLPLPGEENPSLNSSFIGFFNYEQNLRYRVGTSAPMPSDAIGLLPLAKLFDEEYYLQQNPDVAAAVASGILQSGYGHFVQHGLGEGRDPSLLYSEAFYLANNADVAQAKAIGLIQSGLEHFLAIGHKESRDPSALFNQSDYLTRNTDVAAAVDADILQSAFEHYIHLGIEEEGRLPATTPPTLSPLYNEAFYLRTNPDVAAAVDAGNFVDGLHHFAVVGQLENRQSAAQLDLSGYLAANSDVAAAINAGTFTSAFDHYAQFGRFENRPLA